MVKKILPSLFVFIFVLSGFSFASEEIAGQLGNSTRQIMDKEGNKILRGILEKKEISEDLENQVKNMRPKVLKRTARTLALQKAVKWRYEKIMRVLKNNEMELSRIFDFSPLLMREDKVLPPVISEAGAGYRVESQNRASSTGRVFEIIKPARMITKAPSWRNYLLQKYPSFEDSDVKVGVLPKNDEERKLWKNAAIKGWEEGLRLANHLFRMNLNKLVRDYKGILKFRLLAEQNIVSVPIVAEGQLGIQVEGKRLSIDRRVFRITQPCSFQEVKKWKPQIKVD